MSVQPVVDGGDPKGSGKKRKKMVEDYAKENPDFVAHSMKVNADGGQEEGQDVVLLVCKYCCAAVSARSDRIKEHLRSKNHRKERSYCYAVGKGEGMDLNLAEIKVHQEIVKSITATAVNTQQVEGRNEKTAGTSEAATNSGEEDQRKENEQYFQPTTTIKQEVVDYSCGKKEVPNPQRKENQSTRFQPIKQEAVDDSYDDQVPTFGRAVNSNFNLLPATPNNLVYLKWKDGHTNEILSTFSRFRAQEHLVDVTLWCEGKAIKCHKVILSAASPYFAKVLQEIPSPHPVICMTQMRRNELETLVEFMYSGEMIFDRNIFPGLLQAAESLQIQAFVTCAKEPNVEESNFHQMNNTSSSTVTTEEVPTTSNSPSGSGSRFSMSDEVPNTASANPLSSASATGSDLPQHTMSSLSSNSFDTAWPWSSYLPSSSLPNTWGWGQDSYGYGGASTTATDPHTMNALSYLTYWNLLGVYGGNALTSNPTSVTPEDNANNCVESTNPPKPKAQRKRKRVKQNENKNPGK